jgi:hypothetical protein
MQVAVTIGSTALRQLANPALCPSPKSKAFRPTPPVSKVVRSPSSASTARPGGHRIHMEDFAQVFGLFPDDKYGGRSYANIAAMLWAGEEGAYEFVRRLVSRC